MTSSAPYTDTVELARRIRVLSVHMVHKARAAHIGSCMSIADLLAVLYGRVLNVDPTNPSWEGRDFLLLSKGHAAAVLYAVLAERGFFPSAWLNEFLENGQLLSGHVSHCVPGVEFSTGSLGHGLAVGCGIALASRESGGGRVYVILGDGECDEGSVWESLMFAGHHRLVGLVAIIDYNRIQSFGRVSEVMELEPLEGKLRAFGWTVRRINGHDHEELLSALTAPSEEGRPTIIVSHSVKGKGVSFMEDNLLWHYRSPSDDLLRKALVELGETE